MINSSRPARKYPLCAMRLSQVIPGARPEAADLEIDDLAYDNRSVRPGTLFFCVPGFDARRPRLRGRRGRAAGRRRWWSSGRSTSASRRSWCPARARDGAGGGRGSTATRRPTLEVVGITGTNGKTTTAYLLREMLEAGGRLTG